ncbi:hypothetical protein MRB56_08745 [Halomonas cupida]|uniref:hypothetical protein n=1 Tax=Halomonas cupida TaxID=44933 RepID=UPI0039B3C797
MADKDPMFDLEDCEDVDLEKNKTTAEAFVRAKGTKRLRGGGNQAGSPVADPQPKSWHETAWGKVTIGLLIGGLLILAKFLLG